MNSLMAIIKGMLITLKYALFRPVRTREYPDVEPIRTDRTRHIHKLHRYADGMERCVACGLCAKVCPSEAIYLEARENDPNHPTSPGERYVTFYDIDMLRCIFCGYCEEACPEDAIRLHTVFDSGDDAREKLVYNKDDLLVPPDQGDGEHFQYYNRSKQ